MKKTTKPLVSVNIRTYNSAHTLKETLLSIKNQSYSETEVLISDGHSKDKSVKIAESFGAKVQYADKLGDARKQNQVRSHGKYVLSLDSDQTLELGIIEECVNYCEKERYDAVIISEKSVIKKGTYLERLIAYDKWLIDQYMDDGILFGSACPRFFRKKLLDKIQLSQGLSIFDDTILYAQMLENGAKVKYMKSSSILHQEVSSWTVFARKFFRYGQGYAVAWKQNPTTIATRSLPRRSYFSWVALT
ncbi:MAG: glycosyltransferase family 2 protein, partial [bacterium]|nr:glycosyltransferase family 2 protein [bacterium]